MAQFTMTEVKVYDEMSEETLACSAKLLLDGEIVGHVRNSGTGGGTYIRWNSREARDLWEKLLKTHPELAKMTAKGLRHPEVFAEERILDKAIEAGGGLVMESPADPPAQP